MSAIGIFTLTVVSEKWPLGSSNVFKFQQFQRLPSVMEYVLVSQDRMVIERYVRQPDETWNLKTFDDPSGQFSLTTVKVKIPLADIYRDVDLSEDPLP